MKMTTVLRLLNNSPKAVRTPFCAMTVRPDAFCSCSLVHTACSSNAPSVPYATSLPPLPPESS